MNPDDPMTAARLRDMAGENLYYATNQDSSQSQWYTSLAASQLEAAYWIERRAAERLPDAFTVATVNAMFGAVLSGDSFTIRRDGKPVAVAVPLAEWEHTLSEYDRLTREDDE